MARDAAREPARESASRSRASGGGTAAAPKRPGDVADAAPIHRARAAAGAVRVEAPARLQMGLLDLRGDLGRLFGGVGVALAEPRTVVEVRAASGLTVQGAEAGRAEAFARRFLAHHGLPEAAAIRVERQIPAHVGLGSGTQLALAIARGLAELYDVERDVSSLAAAVRRGERSGVGSWIFGLGGLVVDGGHRVDARARGEVQRGLAPLLGRYPVPASWRCVVAIPSVPRGLSGQDEREAFRTLPPPPPELVGRIAHVLLMGILPSLLEEDLPRFGRAVIELQRLVGMSFAPVQGSTYAGPEVAEAVHRLMELGAAGAGQSSWGPAVYGFVDGEDAALELAGRIAETLGGRGQVFETAFDNEGARVKHQREAI